MGTSDDKYIPYPGPYRPTLGKPAATFDEEYKRLGLDKAAFGGGPVGGEMLRCHLVRSGGSMWREINSRDIDENTDTITIDNLEWKVVERERVLPDPPADPPKFKAKAPPLTPLRTLYGAMQFQTIQARLLRAHAEIVSGAYKLHQSQVGCGTNEDGTTQFRDMTEDEKLASMVRQMNSHIDRLQEHTDFIGEALSEEEE